jgi:hypothetical protein
MKKTFPLLSFVLILVLNACTPAAAPRSAPVAGPVTQPPAPTSPGGQAPADQKPYANTAFGLSFRFPSGWYGPDEYVSGQSLRVEVATDTVQPYGGDQPTRPPAVRNSYNVVVQYTKQAPESAWKDTYGSLQGLQDGGSLAGVRSLLIRQRALDLGRFKGFEYIATLSETAQTDHVYIRTVILVDAQTGDLLSVMGQPVNVELGQGVDWRTAYQSIDEANLAAFHAIVESLKVE